MTPDDLALLRVPGTPTLSPDGRRAVLAVSRPDLDADAYRSELWLVGTTQGGPPPQRITAGPRDTAPRWSPDGRWLAFLRAPADGGGGQLHVLPADLGEPRAASTPARHPLGVDGPRWSPDGSRIGYLARVPEPGRYGTGDGVTPDREPPRRITTLTYREDGIGFLVDQRQHVFTVDPFADGPAPVQVTDGDWDDSAVTWSPDGRRLLFVSSRHAHRDTTLYSDVYSCTADGGDLRRLTTTTLRVADPAVPPDGSSVLFPGAELGANGRDLAGRPAALWTVPLDADGTTAPVRLTAPDVDLVTGPDAVVPFAGGALVGRLRRGSVELLRVAPPGVPGDPPHRPEPTALLAGPCQVTGWAAAGGTVVAVVADPTSAGELVVLDLAGGRPGSAPGKPAAAAGHPAPPPAGPHPLTSFGAELSRSGGLRPMQELHAAAPDGYPVHGWLVRPDPAAFPGRRPVLLSIHGGPFAQYGWTLFDEAQVYAGAGYAVVMGNPRGSAGYGVEHGRAIVGVLGTLDADDLLALLDAALAGPGVDADRVGVLGGSYGGLMTTWLAGHTGRRFAAAISERAVNAWDSFTGSSDIGHHFTEEYAGTDAGRLAAQSPLTFADRIEIPVLIIHSEQDWRCPVEQAQRLFVALRGRGLPAELLLFPGEGHELSRSGLPSHRLARFDAVLDWWRRYLGAELPERAH